MFLPILWSRKHMLRTSQILPHGLSATPKANGKPHHFLGAFPKHDLHRTRPPSEGSGSVASGRWAPELCHRRPFPQELRAVMGEKAPDQTHFITRISLLPSVDAPRATGCPAHTQPLEAVWMRAAGLSLLLNLPAGCKEKQEMPAAP